MNQTQMYAIAAAARLNFTAFIKTCNPATELTLFHKTYYNVLQAFAEGQIKRLIISMPPQHGKSYGSTEKLPAYLLGKNPNINLVIASYSFALARKFNQRIQRTIDSPAYNLIFPETKLKSGQNNGYTKTTEEFDVIGYNGNLRSIGRGGGLTGNRVDIMIIDDLYKDAQEANSPITRESTWDWYTSVVQTRLHNDSQELIVFTRWHEDDLIGRIEKSHKIIELHSLDQIEDPKCWYKLNYEAIKASPPTPLDTRKQGQPLWPSRHSLETLESKRAYDAVQFDCMYQGNPVSIQGLLYGDNIQIYDTMPADSQIIKIANYTDTADTGTDYLCSICYCIDRQKRIYITDILYTQEPMEMTEGATASLLRRNNTRIAYVESNNGGRGFARTIQRLSPSTKVEWFHQSANKESRILTNSATVLGNILMPIDWQMRWPDFYQHLIAYKRTFSANAHDDAADTLTGIVEREILGKSSTTTFRFSQQ